MLNICIVCKSQDVIILKKYNEYLLYKCRKCNVISLNPSLSKKFIIENNINKYNSDIIKTDCLKRKRIFLDRAEQNIKELQKYRSIKGNLLDIGCGYGYYLKAFNDNGYLVEGIDISYSAIQYVRNKLKLKVIYGDFLKYNFGSKKYDIILLYDVIEHFKNPIKVIRKINKILKKNGIIIIQTPNYDSLISKICGSQWFWLNLPYHVTLFNPISIKFIITKEGYDILSFATWDDIDEFIKNILWICKLKDKGKTFIIYIFLFYILKLLSFLSIIWRRMFLGGEIIIYAQKRY